MPAPATITVTLPRAAGYSGSVSGFSRSEIKVLDCLPTNLKSNDNGGKLFNQRADPFERADYGAIDYGHWRLDRVFLPIPAQAYVAQCLQLFQAFPPRQRPSSFPLDQVLNKLYQAAGANQ